MQPEPSKHINSYRTGGKLKQLKAPAAQGPGGSGYLGKRKSSAGGRFTEFKISCGVRDARNMES